MGAYFSESLLRFNNPFVSNESLLVPQPLLSEPASKMSVQQWANKRNSGTSLQSCGRFSGGRRLTDGGKRAGSGRKKTGERLVASASRGSPPGAVVCGEQRAAEWTRMAARWGAKRETKRSRLKAGTAAATWDARLPQRTWVAEDSRMGYVTVMGKEGYFTRPQFRWDSRSELEVPHRHPSEMRRRVLHHAASISGPLPRAEPRV
ncbi:hypothetical protein B0H13DRAFT_2274171 [Mycena leptocephala]|nr:hypothetical protein B0H13DRAFT_2274171 [Mycena leptocephala]